MRPLLALLLVVTTALADSIALPTFDIREGDRVLFLGDVLLEREGTYGYLETRMHEQFADRSFTVRNLSWAGDTPLGVSRAAFDPPAKGWERLKESIAVVKPTVVFLGYGMAASLQELTDRSQEPTLNRDPARYGAEPMTPARFKREMGMLMDAIEGKAEGGRRKAEDKDNPAQPPSALPTSALRPPPFPSPRFVLLSPIRHEDLRALRPGLPDPAAHNKLLAEYAKAIEELAKERGAWFVNLFEISKYMGNPQERTVPITDNGIHLNAYGFVALRDSLPSSFGWRDGVIDERIARLGRIGFSDNRQALRAAVIAKNELFFHQFRPANSTYLFGFRKHEQGQNAKEMPMFDPLIEKAEAEIERLKRSPALPRASEASAPARPPGTSSKDGAGATPAGRAGALGSETGHAGARPSEAPPLPTFTVEDGYQIELWAENPLLEKPTEMNWDALGRLWVCSSSLYPMIEPGQPADDKILILSDPTASGRATKSEVFARGLLIPTGVVPDFVADGGKAEGGGRKAEDRREAAPQASSPPPAAGANSSSDFRPPPSAFSYGCYVGQSTELLHFSPTGTKRIILSGFGTEDTHHIIHTLRWGPDGRLYFNQSIYIHSHLETPWGLVRLNSGGCLAYDPRTERVEVFAKGWINSWGHAWDRWGQSFFTDGAGGGGINWAFPGATFVTYEGARQTVPSVSPGSYPKMAGLELIYSPHFPADWQGNAVTCDFRAHRIVRFAITDLAEEKNAETQRRGEEKGTPAPDPSAPLSVSAPLRSNPTALSSGYVTKEMPDLVRTSDLSFRPIDVKLGPDGALYVADWSNPVINHGEVDFRDPRRDHHMGRIWRISKKGAPVVQWEAALGKKTPELLDGLLSGSLWEKEQARQVLRKRGSEVFEEARKWSDLVPRVGEQDLTPLARLETALLTDSASEADFGRLKGLFTTDDGRLRAAVARLWLPARHTAMRRFFEEVKRDSESIRKELDAARVKAQKRFPNDLQKQEEAVHAAVPLPPDGDDIGELVRNFDKPIEKALADPNPRVRLEAMRALARIPTARSAELVLDAAVRSQALPRADEALPRESLSPANPPAGRAGALGSGERAGALGSDAPDVFYNHAAWLSINDLAQPWLAALADGTWKAEGREQQLAFALGALPPDAARGALVQVLGSAPRDLAKGPWVELIGRSGGPAELRRLLDAMLVSFGTDCCPGEELKNIHAVPIDDATALRCVNALLEAARVRNQRPDGDLLPVERLVFRTGGAVRAGMLRLVGYWKPAPGLDWLRGVFEENALDPAQAASAIESLRDLGGAPAIALLKKLAAPASTAPTRQRAAVALAALDPKAPEVAAALAASPDEGVALTAWRDLFKTQKAIDALAANVPADLPKPVAIAGIRAAREAGKKGEAMLAALTPLAGNVPKPAPAAADFKGIAARMWTQGGDAAQGELIYRRATLGCVSCHAIGGAGGIVGPSLTSLGASAPADYIIESLLVPNAKVKEGYNGVTLKLKDGTEVMGIQARETAQEVILRNVAGQETAVPKANIAGKTDIGSIMPAGLLDALNDNERMNLYCFLAELGKPGPFDASKANAARVWNLYPGTTTFAAMKAGPNDASAKAFTLVDGRLTKAQLTEALQLVTNPGGVIYAVTQFQSTGKTRLDLTGIAKAILDGAPLTITPDLTHELPAGVHTLAVKLDVPALPEVLRAASPDASFTTN